MSLVVFELIVTGRRGAMHSATRTWYTSTFPFRSKFRNVVLALSSSRPAVVHDHAWPADAGAASAAGTSIRDGHHTLIAAPTGSGKTLAAFLIAIDELFAEGLAAPLAGRGPRLYVSPLKALSTDIHKNLAEPRRGIRELAESRGSTRRASRRRFEPETRPRRERAAMLRTPPHILVTTPESLYLLLTSERSRQMLRTVRTVIVDEIHAVIGTRRGAHLALSLERLQRVAGRPLLRIGLSATQKPIDEVARCLVGDRRARPCTIVDEGHAATIDLGIEIPRSALDAVMAHEVWGEYYDRLAALIDGAPDDAGVRQHAADGGAPGAPSERAARRETPSPRIMAACRRRNVSTRETRLKSGQLRALVATASLELGIDIGHVDLVCQIGSPHRIATLLQRVGRSGHTVSGTPKGRLFPASRDDLWNARRSCGRSAAASSTPSCHHDAPLDVLAQQIVAEAACAGVSAKTSCLRWRARAWPYRDLTRKDFDAVADMVADGFSTRRGRRAALLHRDEVNATLRGRRGSETARTDLRRRDSGGRRLPRHAGSGGHVHRHAERGLRDRERSPATSFSSATRRGRSCR